MIPLYSENRNLLGVEYSLAVQMHPLITTGLNCTMRLSFSVGPIMKNDSSFF